MKQLLFILLILSFFVACDQTPKNPVAEYGDALMNAYSKGQEAQKIANLYVVRQTVQVYHATNDRYPEDLDDIKDKLGPDIDISKYAYNPSNGMVTLKGN